MMKNENETILSLWMKQPKSLIQCQSPTKPNQTIALH